VSDENKTRIAIVEAPYGREVWLDDVQFESGMRLLRMTIKEGRRFTQLDFDAATSDRLSQIMMNWAQSTTEDKSG
jgi:hypothetical protein